MVVGGCEGHLALGIHLPDLGLGVLHVFKGVGGAILLQDPILRNALLQQVALHAGALGADLVRPLAAGGDENGGLAGGGLLLLGKAQGPVQPPPQQGRGRPVLAEAAAQDDEKVLVRLRLMPRGDGVGYDRAEQHALKIQIHRREEIRDEIVDHDLPLAAGDCIVKAEQKHHASHEQK